MIYTAVAGNYPVRTDIHCFKGEGVFSRPVMDAKPPKILAHLYLPDEPATIWLDGNIWPLLGPQALIDKYLGEADMALFAHPRRKTVWEEFATLREDAAKGGRMAIPWLQQQLAAQEEAYRAAQFRGGPLFECNFMIRRNTPTVAALMNAWWAEICRWQWRDQVSLPYVLWKYPGARVNIIKGPNIRAHEDFRYVAQY